MTKSLQWVLCPSSFYLDNALAKAFTSTTFCVANASQDLISWSNLVSHTWSTIVWRRDQDMETTTLSTKEKDHWIPRHIEHWFLLLFIVCPWNIDFFVHKMHIGTRHQNKKVYPIKCWIPGYIETIPHYLLIALPSFTYILQVLPKVIFEQIRLLCF